MPDKERKTLPEAAAALQLRSGNERAGESGPDAWPSRYPQGFRILMGTKEVSSYREHSSIRVWPYDKGYACSGHHHSAVEIVLCVEGEIECTVEDMTCKVTSGHILIIPSMAGHAMKNEDGTVRYIFVFETDSLGVLRDMPLIGHRLRSPIYFGNDTPDGREAYDLLMKVAECYAQSRPMWNMECYGYLMQFYAIIGRRILKEQNAEEGTVAYTANAEMMNRVLVYIEQNQTGPISLDKVAEVAGVSRFYFSRLFNAYAGMSFTEYLNRRRLAQADFLLISTREPVNEIARRVGFGSLATFSRVFMNVHNCTPTEFRKIYTEE